MSTIAAAAWFRADWSPCVVLDADLRIRTVNEACARSVGRSRNQLAERYLFDVFPENPADPTTDGASRLSQSFERVLRSGERQWMGIQRYDVPNSAEPGTFVRRVWALVNAPIKRDGRVVGIINHAQDITEMLDCASKPRETEALDEALNAAAHQLEREFPLASIDTVLSILAHSHRVVLRELGTADVGHATHLARLRLEVYTLQPARPTEPVANG